MKKIVYDRRNKNNPSLEYGDFVVCENCEKVMLVNIGEETCPFCNRNSLAWENENIGEVESSYFNNHPGYVLISGYKENNH